MPNNILPILLGGVGIAFLVIVILFIYIQRKANNKKRAEKADLKLRSYRQKLISCLVFKNYERFIEIVLQLSAYSQVSMGFLSDLAENFEENKNLAYVFTNNLENFRVDKEEGEK